MPSIQTRVFWRISLPSEHEIGLAITAVTDEVNTFLAALPNLGDALDVRSEIRPIGKYGIEAIYTVTVVYVAT